MPPNTQPRFTITPHMASCEIPQANIVPKSDGVSAGSGNDNMYIAVKAGANGTYVTKLTFTCTAASAAVASTATALQIMRSTVMTNAEGEAAGATTAANTHFVRDINVPAVTAAHGSNASPTYEIPLNLALKAGEGLLVSQRTAMVNACKWRAHAYAGDY